MNVRTLRARLILAGCVLVTATVACGAWGVFTLARLSAAVGRTLQQSERRIELTADLVSNLEREDDALLLSLHGDVTVARRDLAERRKRFDETFAALRACLTTPEEEAAAGALRRHVEAYHRLGDRLLGESGQARARALYHARVNPALRRARDDFGPISELNFRSMQAAAAEARNRAWQATWVVAGVSLAALALSVLVAVRLAGAILGPIRELTRGAEAIGQDDFDRRVPVDSADELGRLAEAFNRMAENLAEYRNSSLGELLLAKTTLEATLAALPDAVIVIDPDGRVLTRNPVAAEVLRVTGAAEAGRLPDLPLGPAARRAVEGTLRGEPAADVRADLSQALTVPLNGRPRKMLLTVAPIPEVAPRRCGAVLVLADVTDFARLDELRSELVAVASHELKTPLTSLGMNLLLLQEQAENLTPRQRLLLSAAVLGVEELAGTIDELLDLTRIEAGQLRILREPVDLGAVLGEAVRALRPRFEDAEVALHVAKGLPAAVIRGDAARLRIVFVNLLVNALKYTPRGGEVSVRLAPAQEAAGGGRQPLQIAVTDTGSGIPPEFRERVFEKFFRVEHQRDEGAEGVRGAGIGLYLCRQIVEAHGGAIWCEAGEGGRGTRVAMRFAALGDDLGTGG
jgi:NtrC-family two-component system sensor histidine kinase KinB